MKLSARNTLKGKIIEINRGIVTAKIKLDIGGGNIITAVISIDSVDELDMKVGDMASAIIKSTEIIIGLEE